MQASTTQPSEKRENLDPTYVRGGGPIHSSRKEPPIFSPPREGKFHPLRLGRMSMEKRRKSGLHLHSPKKRRKKRTALPSGEGEEKQSRRHVAGRKDEIGERTIGAMSRRGMYSVECC